MKYRELRITANREQTEALQTALIEAGFESMQIDDPSVAEDIVGNQELYKYDYLNEEIRDIADSGSDEAVITLYFGDDEEGKRDLRRAAETARAAVKEAVGGCVNAVVIEEKLTGDDSEWLYKWQEHFRPTKVGSRIVVKPGWEDYEPADGELVIEMDPGMAFGSGLHETTSMCIRALEKYMAEGAKVLDVGTGTGILAIAAALLGAADCLGIDIDSEAVRVASENTARNRVGDTVAIAPGDLMAGIDFDADIIVANLMADLVIRLSPAAAAQLDTGGIYITSGILDIKEDTVTAAIRDAGFDILEVLSDGEWRAVVAEKM